MAGAEAIDLNQPRYPRGTAAELKVRGRESEHGGHDERQDKEEDRRRGSRFGAGTGDERYGWRVGQGDERRGRQRHLYGQPTVRLLRVGAGERRGEERRGAGAITRGC